ncbi:MAG: fructokinase-1, putative [Osedax symbiont Rs2]|nr:MAG: fructokinase-1, putative [Osedax symbiont Rs2]
MLDLVCLGEPIYELNQRKNGDYRPGLGGDVSNVAIAAARSNADVALLSSLGKDAFAEQFREFWSNEKVTHSAVISSSQRPTGMYFVTHDSAGHHFSYRRQGSAASRYRSSDLPLEMIKRSKISYASGISLAISNSMAKAVFKMFSVARAAGQLCAFDPNYRPALWDLETATESVHQLMSQCDIALPGLDDARLLTGLVDPQQIVAFYHELGASIVALTLGARGVLVSDAKKMQLIQPIGVQAVDATGAGDCFNGAFLAEYLAGRDVFSAAQYANVAAGLSTQSYTAVAAIPNRGEIEQRLSLL